MAIGQYVDQPIKHAGNWTFMDMGSATPMTYQRTKARLQAALLKETDKGQRELLGSMISDCDYIIEWLRTGRRPDSYKGVEKPYSTIQSNVTKVCSWDPAWIEAYNSPNAWTGYVSQELTTDEQWRLDDAMRDLSERERQCYILHHGFGMDQRQIAQELHMGRSSVQKYLERASKKIEESKATNLFFLG